MSKLNRIFWPVITTSGLVLYLTLVHLISLGNPYYVYNDNYVNFSLYLIPVGAIGSLLSICSRYGFKRTRPLFIIWSIALISVILLYTGDDLSSLGWALIAYPSVITGTVLILVYSVRSPKQLQ
jgi:hypothetical protein